MIDLSIYVIPGLAERKQINDRMPVPVATSTPGTYDYFNEILCTVSAEFGVPADDVRFLKTRQAKYVLPRQISMFIIAKTGKYSISEVGRWFLKDHATVYHSVKVIANMIETDKQFVERTKYLLQ